MIPHAINLTEYYLKFTVILNLMVWAKYETKWLISDKINTVWEESALLM